MALALSGCWQESAEQLNCMLGDYLLDAIHKQNNRNSDRLCVATTLSSRQPLTTHTRKHVHTRCVFMLNSPNVPCNAVAISTDQLYKNDDNCISRENTEPIWQRNPHVMNDQVTSWQ